MPTAKKNNFLELSRAYSARTVRRYGWCIMQLVILLLVVTTLTYIELKHAQ